MPLISAAANAPVYGFLDQYIGRGIVGGSLYSTSMHGMEAAKLTLQVLANSEGSGPSLLEPSSNKVAFDWRQIQRWGISEKDLPLGSEIYFRDPTVWDQYRGYILAALLRFFSRARCSLGLCMNIGAAPLLRPIQ